MDIDQPTVPPFDTALQLPHEESFSSLSPDSLYSYSLEEYNNFANSSYNTDFSADSPLSLGSPVSPTTSCIHPGTTVLGFDTTWAVQQPLDADELTFVKPEPADSPLAFSAAYPAAVDPLQLSGSSSSAASADDDFFALSASTPTTATTASITTTASTRSSIAMPSPHDRRSFCGVRKPSMSAGGRKNSAGGSTSLKRKSIGSPTSPQLARSPPLAQSAGVGTAYEPPKKTAHNLIEKRYRTNLNDKILALRDAVPALRVVARQVDAASDEDEEQMGRYPGVVNEDLGGLAPAHKLNKATILGKATEYIAHLERRNEMLARENESLRGKVDDYEMFVMSRRLT